MQFECGTRILRVIHGRDAGATPSNCTITMTRYSIDKSHAFIKNANTLELRKLVLNRSYF